MPSSVHSQDQQMEDAQPAQDEQLTPIEEEYELYGLGDPKIRVVSYFPFVVDGVASLSILSFLQNSKLEISIRVYETLTWISSPVRRKPPPPSSSRRRIILLATPCDILS